MWYCTFECYFHQPCFCSVFVVSAREAELRRLRKANIEFQEQNAVLQRHIKDMYNAKERLEAELGMDEKRTQALHEHLQAIKKTLVDSLSSVPLPGQSQYISSVSYLYWMKGKWKCEDRQILDRLMRLYFITHGKTLKSMNLRFEISAAGILLLK